MKKISEILMAAGGTVVIIGAMCEADGIYYDLLLIAIAFGLILLMAGMRLYRTAEQRERERRKNWITERKKSHVKQNQTEVQAFEQILIEDYISSMKREHPDLELEPQDIYNTAFRRGLEAQIDQIRQERRQKTMEEWIYGTKSHKKTGR